MRPQVEAILSQLGIASAPRRDTVYEVVDEVLAAHDLTASVVSVRWGELVLEAHPEQAPAVRFLKDVLLSRLSAAGSDIHRLVVRSARFTDQTV